MPKSFKKVVKSVGKGVNNRKNIKSFASAQEIGGTLLQNSNDPRARALGTGLQTSALITRQGAKYAKKPKKRTK